ncbi:hypothetical protein [Pseudomonas sp. S9]|uniref:hypothetical protein n=1 Tax=Pseudomonas sp. S9 TaxID=686578 RepID=UPI003083685A
MPALDVEHQVSWVAEAIAPIYGGEAWKIVALVEQVVGIDGQIDFAAQTITYAGIPDGEAGYVELPGLAR